MLRILLAALAFGVAPMAVATADPIAEKSAAVAPGKDSAQAILQRYASAWRGQSELKLNRPIVLAFKIKGDGGGDFSVTLTDEASPQVGTITPVSYDVEFETDIDFLRRVDKGEINAVTAMTKATDADVTPLIWTQGKAFSAMPQSDTLFRRLCFFFWNRDWPPTVRFGESFTQSVHGGNAVALLYDEHFRSAWYDLKPGMHAFPGGAKAPFKILLIVTKGHASAKFDGKQRILSEGEFIYIPPGMLFEYWADPGQYGEVVWIALGDNA